MAHDKWFISDTHFLHANILKFVNDGGHRIRPFASLKEMDDYMVGRWNDVVKDQDYVYHLGDVTFQYNGLFSSIMSRLKGRKRLIIGNHDKLQNPNLFRWFEKVEFWKGFPEDDFTATHVPMILNKIRDGQFNVHGHIHASHMEDLRYINVSVEVRDYTPVHIDQIRKEITQAKRKLGL